LDFVIYRLGRGVEGGISLSHSREGREERRAVHTSTSSEEKRKKRKEREGERARLSFPKGKERGRELLLGFLEPSRARKKREGRGEKGREGPAVLFVMRR